jgi:hypothetical protein
MSGIGGSFGTKDMAAAAGEGAAPAAAAPAGADPKDAKKKEPSAPLPGPAAEPQAKVMMTVTGFVGGKLEWDATGKVIRLRLGAVKHCYQKVLKTDPALAGKLVLTIKVDLDGRPTILIAKNELGKDLAKCVIGRMATWVFPKPEGKEAEFKVTFEFKVE